VRLSLLAGLSLVCGFAISASGIWAPPAGRLPVQMDFVKYVAVEKHRADVLIANGKPKWVLPIDPWIWETTDLWGAGRGHQGIDVAVKAGKNAYSVSKGVVVFSGWNWPYGNLVKVKFDLGGDIAWYAHLLKRKVKKGDVVEVGEVVGLVGNTGYSFGNHLHFGIQPANGKSKFIDPYPWLKDRIKKKEWRRTWKLR